MSMETTSLVYYSKLSAYPMSPVINNDGTAIDFQNLQALFCRTSIHVKTAKLIEHKSTGLNVYVQIIYKYANNKCNKPYWREKLARARNRNGNPGSITRTGKTFFSS